MWFKEEEPCMRGTFCAMGWCLNRRNNWNMFIVPRNSKSCDWPFWGFTPKVVSHMQGVGGDVERQDMQYYTESVVCTQVVSLSSMLMPSYVPLPAISMQAHRYLLCMNRKEYGPYIWTNRTGWNSLHKLYCSAWRTALTLLLDLAIFTI